MPDLNLIVSISLVVLAFSLLCLFIVIIPIAIQLSRTLGSMQNLIDTLNNDLNPTLREIKQSASSVKEQLSMFKVASKSLLCGLLVGIKDYFASYKTSETSYNGKEGEKKLSV